MHVTPFSVDYQLLSNGKIFEVIGSLNKQLVHKN